MHVLERYAKCNTDDNTSDSVVQSLPQDMRDRTPKYMSPYLRRCTLHFLSIVCPLSRIMMSVDGGGSRARSRSLSTRYLSKFLGNDPLFLFVIVATLSPYITAGIITVWYSLIKVSKDSLWVVKNWRNMCKLRHATLTLCETVLLRSRSEDI